jgi:hypothetical protein
MQLIRQAIARAINPNANTAHVGGITSRGFWVSLEVGTVAVRGQRHAVEQRYAEQV